jgi:hypothetical protein
VCILECRIIGVLGRADKRAEEDPLEGLFFEGNAEVWACAVGVDEGDKEGEDYCDQGVELGR